MNIPERTTDVERPLRADLQAAIAALIDAKLDADDAVLSFEISGAAAYARLRRQVSHTVADLTELAERVPPEAPARPLEAVLADIEAEGHDDIALEHDPAHYEGRWRLQTHHSAPRYLSKGSVEEHRRWVEEVEDGAVFGDSPVDAAEERLAEIRELHEQKRISVRWVVEMFDTDWLGKRFGLESDFTLRNPGQAIADAQDAAGADES